MSGLRRRSWRVEPLEAREVPATIALPSPWYLSSTWIAFRAGPATPPVSNPTPPQPPPTTPTVSLAAASDTGTPGDRITTLATVTLNGTTSANTRVRLLPTGARVTADATGAYQFTSVPLAAGANDFTVRATRGGATASAQIAVTRQSAPTVQTAPAPVSVAAGNSTTVDLAGTFTDADIANSRVRFDTSAGPVNVELFDKQAPRTVANFLNYVNDGDYADSIFHRSAKLTGGVPFVLQGGGFEFNPTPTPSLAAVPTDPPVQNEPDAVNRSNLRGTLAMAKLGGNPNSATNQFFFNLGNNSANLDSQNGGFTVFGKVVGTADQAVVDQLAAIPTQDQSTAASLPPSQKGVFGEIPLTGYTGTDFPTDTTRSNYAIINGVSIVSQPEALTYSIVSNSTPSVATATVTNNRLSIQGVAAGQTAITVRATDKAGATVETTVNVTVS